MQEESFDNFLTDILVRSFECHDWISEELAELDSQVEEGIRNIPESRRSACKSIYQAMVKSLQENVKISYGESLLDIEDIYYHKRFGWVLNANPYGFVPNEAKIFLGKLSLLEDTQVVMGRRTYISGSSVIRGGAELNIGGFCSLAEGLYINTFRDFHPMTHASTVNLEGNRRILEDGLSMPIHYSEFEKVKNGIKIGSDVWIGRNVRISHGVNIGDGCIIGERSLIRNDCEPYGIYVGTPARLIRYRFNKCIQEQLLKTCWWDWSFEKIQRNTTFFNTQLTSFNGSLEDLID